MLEQAFGWIGAIAQWLGQWFPRWIVVPPYGAGAKFPGGKRTVRFGPGITWYWPATTTVLRCNTSRVVLNLQPQRLTTSDGFTVEVGGVVTYQVVDPVKFLVDTHVAEDAIDDACLAGIRRIVTRRAFKALQEGQSDLDDALTNSVARGVEKDFGVRVLSVRLSDLAKTRMISLSGLDLGQQSGQGM